MNKVSIGEILDVKTIQLLQESFFQLTGVRAQIYEASGEPVTECNIDSEYCSEVKEYAGLKDFIYPIVVDGLVVGNFYVGYLRSNEIKESEIRKIAIKHGQDPEKLLEQVQNIPLKSSERIKAIKFSICQLTEVLSSMAMTVNSNIRLREEAEHVARLKSDFLANMSHEIRTPMNAVIGMAEMALRENLPERGREYLYQIKASGKTLLAIINDILDFSKIESGKMEIVEEEYELLPMVNDIIHIIQTRIGEKEIELVVDVDPTVPYLLIGDSVRVKQVMMNLLDNAAKFTTKGAVILRIGYQKTQSGIDLIVSVSDTGIGIQSEKIGMLFESFQQLDSKRNRNVEGTGLGLALTKSLLDLMNGNIEVESVYEKGSTFKFRIPQKVSERYEPIKLEKYTTQYIAGYFNNEYVKASFGRMMEQLGVTKYQVCETQEEVVAAIDEGVDALFVEFEKYTLNIRSKVVQQKSTECFVLADSRYQYVDEMLQLHMVPKPVFALAGAARLKNVNFSDYIELKEMQDTSLAIPDTEIMIVDDNAVNLMVAEGLLRIFGGRITTASSGKDALELVQKKHYDLIFMDHMMPEMDGIETARRIHNLGGAYASLPIVALTANAVNDAKEMFLKEGLNDFLGKPIEMGRITEILRRWIPKEKQKQKEDRQIARAKENKEELKIPGLNAKEGLSYTGSLTLYKQALRDYYLLIEEKANRIVQYETDQNLELYTIEVHALKSASRLIGALDLAVFAEELEESGYHGDWREIHKKTPVLVKKYRSYLPILAPYAGIEEKNPKEKREITKEALLERLAVLEVYMEELNFSKVEEVCDEIRKYQLYGIEENCFEGILESVVKLDFGAGRTWAQRWRSEIEKRS